MIDVKNIWLDFQNNSSDLPKVEPSSSPMECDIQNNVSNESKNIDDDDPVVHEIPVFLAKSLAKQLFLYQVKHSVVMSRHN